MEHEFDPHDYDPDGGVLFEGGSWNGQRMKIRAEESALVQWAPGPGGKLEQTHTGTYYPSDRWVDGAQVMVWKPK